MAGVRLGYAISRNNKLLDFIISNQNPWTVNCFAEVAAKYALFDEKFIDESKNWLISERTFMKKSLNHIKIIQKVYESKANYFLCKIKGITSSELLKQLMEKGILIRNCNNYTGLNDSFVRVAIKTRDMNETIIKALSEISS